MIDREGTVGGEVFGLESPFSLATLFGLRRSAPLSVDVFHRLSETLYPDGRAWNLPEGSNFGGLQGAINAVLADTVSDISLSLDGYLPDNENFDESDAALGEYRFGLAINPSLTLEQRRINVYQAMTFPQNIQARQHYSFLQDALNASGFNVKVYENIFIDDAGQLYHKTPAQVLGSTVTQTMLSNTTMLGGSTMLGGGVFSVIANSAKRENFSLGGNLWATFFIAGETISSFANIPASREQEFRNLVLEFKAAHLIAFLFVNYI